ncbi:hypothetical protein KDU71_18930 [Carboxylicivirga sediminis]|uniref:Uncharacterized protein n=1 Tax=Carboxylicivirga sediminis TaxID=2006564 RepID=A0A941F6V7_9BACT|nr:hypothetical protein [Carboxylicivirga sediminis]MBR8537652.1 hypothetical protein [Carboxylicivirga sediminis]
MKQIFSILAFICIYNLGFSQHDFLFEKKCLGDIRAHEKSINSICLGFVKYQVPNDFFQTAKKNHDYYPLCYKRTNDDFSPQLIIKYYYDEQDSTLLVTSYDWNIMDHVDYLKTDGDKFEVEKKRKNEYLNKYKTIKQELINKYGEPTTIKETISTDGYLYRLSWENGSNNIHVLLNFSTKLKTLLGNMKFGLYNIRVKIEYI